MPRGIVRCASFASSPSAVAPSNPTKLSAANTKPVTSPLKWCGDSPGLNGARLRPWAPPLATMISESPTTTTTSALKRTSAARSEVRMPSNARIVMSSHGTIPIHTHGMLTFHSCRNVDCR